MAKDLSSALQPSLNRELELRDRALAATAEGVTIADARLPDQPIIYANAGFERLTGYSIGEVVGRNCRFLQGPGTDGATVARLREAIRSEQEITVQLLNYRKDGTAFWNRLSITPVRNEAGDVTHFIGVQSDVTELQRALRELEIANERLNSDIAAAADVQRSLLPQHLPDVPGYRFAWTFRPCENLAGDSLNAFVLGDGRVGLYILDVSGHGVASALLSVTLSHLLSAVPEHSLLYERDPEGQHRICSPAAIANRLNQRFQYSEGRSQYFTLFVGILDPPARELRYVSAGQPGPLHIPACGTARLLEAGGPPVGLLPGELYQEQLLRLAPGDRCIMCTDGIIEAENAFEEEFGLERMVNELAAAARKPLAQALDQLISGVENWAGAAGPADDASVLAFELTA